MKIGKKYKLCRRLGTGVFEKCQNPKFIASQAKRGRGDRKKALSDFGLQLIEKQKIRFGYGITERQLQNYVKEAGKAKDMTISEKLMEILESRLDNVVYRLGFAKTRRHARQLAAHGHFTVNGVRTTIPSRMIKVGEAVAVRKGSKTSPIFANLQEAKAENKTVPAWLSVDYSKLEGAIKSKPKNTENFIDVGSVLEFYSR